MNNTLYNFYIKDRSYRDTYRKDFSKNLAEEFKAEGLSDDDEHKKYTGQSNALILKNASWLKSSKISHLFRTPLIPGITDTEENLTAISSIVGEDKLELLPYNTLAPQKYKSVGRTFPSYINQTCAKLPDLKLFKNARIRK